jgi:vacuolar-type H+-ATPase subunit F/Vma7
VKKGCRRWEKGFTREMIRKNRDGERPIVVLIPSLKLIRKQGKRNGKGMLRKEIIVSLSYPHYAGAC